MVDLKEEIVRLNDGIQISDSSKLKNKATGDLIYPAHFSSTKCSSKLPFLIDFRFTFAQVPHEQFSFNNKNSFSFQNLLLARNERIILAHLIISNGFLSNKFFTLTLSFYLINVKQTYFSCYFGQ